MTAFLFHAATLKDQWTRYEEFYGELSHWIKDTENAMKVDSDLRASLDQKVQQLNKHRVSQPVSSSFISHKSHTPLRM